MDQTLQPRCMIVEDQTVIGMSLEDLLNDMGFLVQGPFMSNVQALHWLENETPDIALLDFMIKDGTSLETARALKNRHIPFAIYSGLSPQTDCPPELHDVPWLEKPMSGEVLAAMLTEIAAPRAAARSAAESKA
ncbi:MAG: response regulator [Microvirga sp.]